MKYLKCQHILDVTGRENQENPAKTIQVIFRKNHIYIIIYAMTCHTIPCHAMPCRVVPY